MQAASLCESATAGLITRTTCDGLPRLDENAPVPTASDGQCFATLASTCTLASSRAIVARSIFECSSRSIRASSSSFNVLRTSATMSFFDVNGTNT